jgi:hypothetical protein
MWCHWGWQRRFTSTHAQTDRLIKFSRTGPFSVSRRVRNKAYDSDPGPGPLAPRTRGQSRHRPGERGSGQHDGGGAVGRGGHHGKEGVS